MVTECENFCGGGPHKSKSAPGTQDYQIEEYSSFNKCIKPLVKMVPNALLYMWHISSHNYTLMFVIKKYEWVCGFPIITETDLKGNRRQKQKKLL